MNFIESISNIEIVNGAISFEEISGNTTIANELTTRVQNANALFFPDGDIFSFIFRSGTMSLYKYFHSQAENTGLEIDIFSPEGHYAEQCSSPDIIVISNLLVQWAVLPIITGIVSSYIFKELEEHKKAEMEADIKITVEKDGVTKMICYKGSTKDFEKTLKVIYDVVFNN